ncbi:MAG: cysteine peptidase family C39 domain-containing protein [Verrucomicrobia bacterium]|nr:cysteine peptidase family C39 domain-containing protein [Verrucomicrobiota bacterium]
MSSRFRQIPWLRILAILLTLGIIAFGVRVVLRVSALDLLRASRDHLNSDQALAPGATFFSQKDLQRSNEKIGGSGEKIRKVGCTLCSLAMAAGDLGYTISPPELNQRLIANNGYTARGWLIWDAVRTATDQTIEVVVHGTPSHAAIDGTLASGEVPLIKFFLPGGIPHWVVVTDKHGDNDYSIKDPACLQPNSVLLSGRAGHIEALRVVRRRTLAGQ